MLKVVCDAFKAELINRKLLDGTKLNCNPWRYMSQAQLCLAVHRAKFLEPNTIGIHI